MFWESNNAAGVAVSPVTFGLRDILNLLQSLHGFQLHIQFYRLTGLLDRWYYSYCLARVNRDTPIV